MLAGCPNVRMFVCCQCQLLKKLHHILSELEVLINIERFSDSGGSYNSPKG
jgi:hypothetical protein